MYILGFFLDNQGFVKLVIISLIVIIFAFDSMVKLYGEITSTLFLTSVCCTWPKRAFFWFLLDVESIRQYRSK